MAVEAGERERLEAVVSEGVRALGLSVQELTQSLGAPECGCLEHVQLRMAAKQLPDAVLVSAVEGFEKLGHVE
jgi:ABC-type Fe3+ transport system permease subunit